MDYKKMTLDDIINWCQEHGEVAWLKEEAAQLIEQDGKTRKISFIEIKHDFVEKFMPELLPAKKKSLSMYDRIAAL